MSTNIGYPNEPGKGKVIAGLVLLGLGVVFLLHQFDYFFFPHWLFRWPMWLIIWGFYAGAKHNFRNSGWLIMILVGMAFLLNDALPDYNMSRFVWPVAIIVFGIWLIVRRNQHGDTDNWGKKKWEDKWNKYQYKSGSAFEPVITPVTPVDPAGQPGATGAGTGTSGIGGTGSASSAPYGDDYLDCVSVFGGVKKTILSKAFKGGEIVNIFGGAELDLTMADINGRVIIDVTQIFGGTKIIVPSNWQVVSDMAAVFAGIDDKRIRNTAAGNNYDKVLVLKGVSIFAGIDIRSY